MAREEDNVESCVVESLSSTSSKDVPSHVGMESSHGLSPLERLGQTHLGGNFLFPPMFGFLFPH